MVNRIWHYHFGRGIVGTPSDFGSKGEPPTHPQLLDWLAGEFVRQGWSLKAMHRLILNSRTYQQASADRDAWVAYAFRLAYGRRPDAGEAEAVKNFFDRHRQILQQQAAAGKKLASPEPSGAVDALDGAVLVDLCHTLLNSNEFVYRN
jgi:hypothetical protein